MRRRVWCEMLTHAEIAAPNVLSALGRRGIGVLVAALPGPLDDLVTLSSRARDAGVQLGVWPMLANEAGRWASAENAAGFSSYVRRLVDELDRRGAAPDEIALDLEPPIERLRRMISLRPLPKEKPHVEDGEEILGALVRDLRERSGQTGHALRVSAAVMPLLLFDELREGEARRGGFEQLCGTPISQIRWDHASVMVYTSLVEGYSRGMFERRDVRPMLAAACRAAGQRFGAVAGASLGAVGKGALGDEATYRSVDELQDDVAIARAAGLDDLTLFDLGGVLRRPPMEAWLDAFVETEPAREPPRWTLRSRAAIGAGLALSRSIRVAYASRRR
jgi:hypothetical protein